MAKRELTFDEVLSYLEKLPYKRFEEAVNHYSIHTKINLEKEMDVMVTLNFQQILEKLKINCDRPCCNSQIIVKNGKENFVQRYKCKGCGKSFTLFTNTVLEKTKWHWDIGIKVLEITLNSYSLNDMKTVLVNDYGCIGISPKTIFLWKHKLIHALASFPMPKLTGVIQIDKTFIRETQKSSKNLISYIKCNCVTGNYYMLITVSYHTTIELDIFIGELQKSGNTQTQIVFSTAIENRGIDLQA